MVCCVSYVWGLDVFLANLVALQVMTSVSRLLSMMRWRRGSRWISNGFDDMVFFCFSAFSMSMCSTILLLRPSSYSYLLCRQIE